MRPPSASGRAGGPHEPARPLRHQLRARRSASAPSRALHEREDVVFALVGGRVRHGGAAPAPVRCRSRCCGRSQRHVARLAGSGRFRAVIAGLSGRVALPAAYAGARAAGVPFVLWATIWRAPAHRRARALLPPAPPPLPPRRRDRHLRAARVGLRARQGRRADRSSRRPRASTARFWEAPRRAAPPGRLPGALRRVAWSARRAWRRCSRPGRGPACGRRHAALVMAGDGPLRAARRRRRRGSVDGPAAGTRRAARPLRGLGRRRRPEHPHARLPRAVGPRRERGLAPVRARRRDDRGRRRRRRARRARAHRPRRAARRPGGARRGAAPPARRPGACARASAQPARAAVAAHSHDAWAAGMQRALAAVGAAKGGEGGC